VAPVTGQLRRLPVRHALLALAVVAVWGTNFVVMKVVLDTLPPLLVAALRFALAWMPAVFFIPRPPVPWRKLVAYGVLIGAGQFGLLYWALTGFISAGLASLVVQTQVFFTIGLALWADGERVRPVQWLALLLAGAGIAAIAVQADGDATGVGLAMVLMAALAWAGGNQVARSMGRVPMLAMVVWSSAFAWPLLLVASVCVEGPARIQHAVQQAGALTWLAVVWQAAANSLFGYAAWGWLLARHPAATVVPMALLVPVFGMGASALLLGEGLPAWKLGAATAVMAGLALNLLWPRRH
jgi:O-acetylserine/cysteine efflux transporter